MNKIRTYCVTFSVTLEVEARQESEARDRAWDELLDPGFTCEGATLERIEDLGVTCE